MLATSSDEVIRHQGVTCIWVWDSPCYEMQPGDLRWHELVLQARKWIFASSLISGHDILHTSPNMSRICETLATSLLTQVLPIPGGTRQGVANGGHLLWGRPHGSSSCYDMRPPTISLVLCWHTLVKGTQISSVKDTLNTSLLKAPAEHYILC